MGGSKEEYYTVKAQLSTLHLASQLFAFEMMFLVLIEWNWVGSEQMVHRSHSSLHHKYAISHKKGVSEKECPPQLDYYKKYGGRGESPCKSTIGHDQIDYSRAIWERTEKVHSWKEWSIKWTNSTPYAVD